MGHLVMLGDWCWRFTYFPALSKLGIVYLDIPSPQNNILTIPERFKASAIRYATQGTRIVIVASVSIDFVL